MEKINTLHSKLEELQYKYWQCFNNWDCDEDLEKLQGQIDELKHKLSLTSVSPRTPETPRRAKEY